MAGFFAAAVGAFLRTAFFAAGAGAAGAAGSLRRVAGLPVGLPSKRISSAAGAAFGEALRRPAGLAFSSADFRLPLGSPAGAALGCAWRP